MKILLTAFEPFGGDAINPAQEAVAQVADRIGEAEIVKLSVPVVFGKSVEVVRRTMEAERPDVVLCIGQAGGRFGLTPERVAINIDDAPAVIDIPDSGKVTVPARTMLISRNGAEFSAFAE